MSRAFKGNYLSAIDLSGSVVWVGAVMDMDLLVYH